MKKGVCLYLGVQAGLCGLVQQSQAQESAKPNIILILADDAGYHDFGFQGDELSYKELTPNIDSIARDGARFMQAYVSCNVCAPSRAGLLTGRYQQQFGFEGNDDPKNWNQMKEGRFGLDTDQQTVADRLRFLGYYTGIVGKWHLGYLDPFYPTNRGFNYFYGLRGGSRPYMSDPSCETAAGAEKFKLLEKNGVMQPENQIKHVTDTFGDAAIQFIDEACGRKKPFFLYLSFTAPHGPLQPDAGSLEKAKKLFPDAPPKRQSYLGLIAGLDLNTGRVLDHLKQCGLDRNTLVVFLSDNGGSDKNASNNDPLRGHKYTPFEGGYRVPMAIKWPGLIKPGTVISEPVISLDLLPTFIAAAGGENPDGLDGINLKPVLAGTNAIPSVRTFFWRDSNSEGLTKTIVRYPWKLILREDAKWKKLENYDPWLFNLKDDLQEKNNLADKYPEVVKELEAVVRGWSSTLEAPRW